MSPVPRTTSIHGGHATLCALVLLASVSCGLGGPNHSAERAAYLDALVAGDSRTAFEELCEKAQDEFGTPSALQAAYANQVRSLRLSGSWGPLRGKSDLAVAQFRRNDGSYVTLSTPLDVVEDTVTMCPDSAAPLGVPG